MQALGTIAHYNLLERLDPAGPGELYRARDTRLGRTVSVRLLPSGFATDTGAGPELIARARELTRLSHPNIITIFDAGEHEGRVFLTFEHLTGQPLRAVMAGRQMNVRRALEIAVQIADAVAHAHAAGFVHGGLSPDSVVITARGHAKIPALDLAARAGFEQDETRLRDYDSPEEAQGKPSDDRSDVYSVGAVLYEMLTTRRPMHRGAAAPSASNTNVPKAVDEVALKAVAPNPDSRYQTAAAVASELRRCIALLEEAATSASAEAEVARRSTSVGQVLLLALVIFGLGAAIVWWILRTSGFSRTS